MQGFASAINKLQIEDNAFVAEMQHCLSLPALAPFLHPTCVEELYYIFISLQAEKPPMSLLFAGVGLVQQPLLADFLAELTAGIEVPPGQPIRLKVLYALYGKLGIDKSMLRHLLSSGAIYEIPITTLNKIKEVYAANIRAIADFWIAMKPHMEDDYYDIGAVGVEILLMLYPTSITDETPALLASYVQTAMPALIYRLDRMREFFPEINLAIYNYRYHIDRVAEWFLVFQNHGLKSDEGAEPDDPYYQLPFETIIEYVPLHIWWNNGVQFRNDEKKFYFGSPEFRFLATGGSVRKVSGLPFPFTRRMAREFVSLPIRMEFENRTNWYLYLYAASLGAGYGLRHLVGEYMRHPDDPEALQAELGRWAPMIQKLSNPLFEEYDEDVQRKIVGYVFHILRDQPLANLTDLSFRQLEEASDTYYARIEERALARARRGDEDIWVPHPTIKPWAHDKGYSIRELLFRWELEQEGNIMGHCVGTYVDCVRRREAFIWSLSSRGKKWVTIEVRNKTIVQSRARFNALPSDEHMDLIAQWAEENGLTFGF